VTEVDPLIVTSSQWQEISSVLVYFWAFAFLLASFAGNLLIAHSLIPSLAITGHIGPSVTRVRPVFYGLAVLFGLAVIWTLVQIVDGTQVLRDIYPKVWI
jgi:hypothetical protein